MEDEAREILLGQRDFSGGMATNLNPALAPRGTVKFLLNMDADEEIGSLVSRLGSALVGSQLVDNQAVLGLHQYVDGVTAANNKLFAAINASGGATSKVMNVIAGTDVVTGLTANKKMRFLSYLGEMLAINGTDAERSWNGSSWITTGGAFDLANFPGSNTCDLAIEFLDRVYAAGDDSNPDRLHYSTISDGSAITWDGDYIDIEPEDGGGRITALAKVPGYQLIFKERTMKRFSGTSAFPESLVNVGTPSQECVVSSGGLCAFFSSSNESERGFFVTNGGRPVPISHDSTRPIKKWVDAIPQASEASIAGYAMDRGFAWSVGDLTVDGVSYTNVHLRYNQILNQWSVRTYPSDHRIFARYLTGGVNAIVAGDDDGNVLHVNKPGTYTDAPGTLDIPWAVETQDRSYGIQTLKRVMDRLLARGVNLNNPVVSIIADGVEHKLSEKSPRKEFLSVFNIPKPVEGSLIAFRAEGKTKSERVTLRELEPIKLEATQNYV